jgi:hypothetical protein
VPAVVVGTDEFQGLVQMEARARGLPDLAFVITPHPLGGLKPDAVAAKAPALADAVVCALRSSTEEAPSR